MRNAVKFLGSLLMLALVVGATTMAHAEMSAVTTPIDNILGYRASLNLSENQIAKLEHFNKELTAEIIKVRAQAEILKGEVDRFTVKWASVNGTAGSHLIDEYYGHLAKLKQLELEAVMKARGVLTVQQMKAYSQLASIDAMIIRMEERYAATY